MPDKLKIFAGPAFAQEKEYIAGILLSELCGLDWEIHFSEACTDYVIELANGTTVRINDAFFGSCNGDYLRSDLIPESGTDVTNPFDHTPLAVLYGEPEFTADSGRYYCGLDLFASAYFMVTRWEEHVLPCRDRHGRFPAEHALATRTGWLNRAIVHEWSRFLEQIFNSLGFRLPERNTRFRLDISCDVDHPELWKNPADWFRSIGGALIRRRDIGEAVYWLKYKLSGSKDPFDVFDEWFDMFEKYNLGVQFNFLSERAKGSDCWYALNDPFVVKTMKKIRGRGHKIGLHTSYESFDHPELIHVERAKLEEISGENINHSRAHYLRFRAPETWQQLSGAGIISDSSVGYPEAEGFRTGMCTSYPVFDFLNRKTLPLREEPLVAMDVTLALYRRYTPQQALERLFELKKEVLKYNGTFTLLWHNSSWNTHFWTPWKRVFTNFIHETRQI
jgi:hypothetical protein